MNVEECKQQIKRHEGEVLSIYEDSLGYKTLGVGHLCQPEDPEYTLEVGTPIAQDVVDLYYRNDFTKHYKEAIHIYGSEDEFNTLPETIQHVLVNMCFNLGGTRLSKFKNMLKACKAGDWNQMAVEMEDSRWFNQVGGRSRELQMMVIGVGE